MCVRTDGERLCVVSVFMSNIYVLNLLIMYQRNKMWLYLIMEVRLQLSEVST